MSSFPTCQVCHQQFSLKGPAPFLLPCLHAVCETCVTSAAGGVVSCSPCQRDINLTETPLQKDVVREKEILHLTVKHNPELILCTHEEDGNQAVCWCEECEDFLCEHCQMVHNSFKITKQHNVCDVGEMAPGSFDEENYCSVHPKVIADTWDKDCRLLTCGKCRRSDHRGHEVVDLEEAAETARNEVARLGKDVLNSLDQHRTVAEKDSLSPGDTTIILAEKISFTFNCLKVLFDQREKELQVDLENYNEKFRNELSKISSEVFHRRCETTSDYINKTLQYSSPQDIIAPFLEEKFQDCRRSTPSEDYKSPDLPMFNTEGLEKIKSTLAQFGTIAAKGDVLHSDIKDRRTQTENDVPEEVEKLKKEVKELKESVEKVKREKEEAKKEYWSQSEKFHQKMKQLKASQDRIISQEQEVESLSAVYRLGTQFLDRSVLLNCTGVEFSKTKYNAEIVHINDKGELINKTQSNPPHSDQRLKIYWGTSSTVPLPQCGAPQYFEVKSLVDVEATLEEEHLLLEIGLAREEEQDQKFRVTGRLHCYSLVVRHCKRHSSICRQIWKHNKDVMCLPVLENAPNNTATLHYGVVYDSVRGTIAFLDAMNENIICSMNYVDSSLALWPMFGVYNSTKGNVSMSLLVESEIDMTGKKKELIFESIY